jgi:hypothetical protein
LRSLTAHIHQYGIVGGVLDGDNVAHKVLVPEDASEGIWAVVLHLSPAIFRWRLVLVESPGTWVAGQLGQLALEGRRHSLQLRCCPLELCLRILSSAGSGCSGTYT